MPNKYDSELISERFCLDPNSYCLTVECYDTKIQTESKRRDPTGQMPHISPKEICGKWETPTRTTPTRITPTPENSTRKISTWATLTQTTTNRTTPTYGNFCLENFHLEFVWVRVVQVAVFLEQTFVILGHPTIELDFYRKKVCFNENKQFLNPCLKLWIINLKYLYLTH